MKYKQKVFLFFYCVGLLLCGPMFICIALDLELLMLGCGLLAGFSMFLGVILGEMVNDSAA